MKDPDLAFYSPHYAQPMRIHQTKVPVKTFDQDARHFDKAHNVHNPVLHER